MNVTIVTWLPNLAGEVLKASQPRSQDDFTGEGKDQAPLRRKNPGNDIASEFKLHSLRLLRRHSSTTCLRDAGSVVAPNNSPSPNLPDTDNQIPASWVNHGLALFLVVIIRIHLRVVDKFNELPPGAKS